MWLAAFKNCEAFYASEEAKSFPVRPQDFSAPEHNAISLSLRCRSPLTVANRRHLISQYAANCPQRMLADREL